MVGYCYASGKRRVKHRVAEILRGDGQLLLNCTNGRAARFKLRYGLIVGTLGIIDPLLDPSWSAQ